MSLGRLHLQPACVEEELQQREDRNVEVEVGAGVELTANQTGEEEGVDSQRDHLQVAMVGRDVSASPSRAGAQR